MNVDLPAEPTGDSSFDTLDSESATESELGEGAALTGLDVLVVEDDREASEMMTMVLSDRGARVRTAADFDTALAAVQQAWPDVLVSDIGLPGRDGYELVRRLRQIEGERQQARLPAIALTAFGRPEDQQKSLDAGFDLHLSKPLKPHLLLEAIERWSRFSTGT
jgi:CheY-like chemotaxis protein